MGEEEKQYAYWLCSLPGIGNRTIWKLLQRYETPRGVFRAPGKELEQMLTNRQLESLRERQKGESAVSEEYAELEKQGIGFVAWGEEKYPQRLATIPDAPYGLFFRGSLPKEAEISVAVIGARECSEYGSYVASELGRYLGERGISVISGMARGIDGISQEAVLDAGGSSFGVLGCGVDVCYPAQNRRLYERLAEQGGILSAYPPKSLPRPQNFPPRNRIVSGLADAVLVIEARQKSGTLITVDMALEQGREVYVVPGRVTDRLSDGCNKLLKQGAGVFLSPEEFLRELRENWARRQPWNTPQFSEENLALEKLPQESAPWESVSPEEPSRENPCPEKAAEWAGQRVRRTDSRRKKENAGGGLAPELQKVSLALDFYPQAVEEIAIRLRGDYEIRALHAALMKLCLDDRAEQVSPGYFCRKTPKY